MLLNDFINFHKKQGGKWFDVETMDFWGSKIKIYDPLTGYFISREKKNFDALEFAYTIRKADFKTGTVETVGRFLEFETQNEALKALRRLIRDRVKGIIEL
jgi:hypothetical protein